MLKNGIRNISKPKNKVVKTLNRKGYRYLKLTNVPMFTAGGAISE